MTILKTAPSPNGRLFMQLRLERGGLLLVCANTLKTKTKKKTGKWPLQGWPRGLGPVLSHVVYMTVLSSAQRQAHGKPFFGVFLRHLLGVVLGRCR